jgi:hypothetical protein
MMMKKITAILMALMLSGCFGMKTEIEIRKDGSGTMNLVYRISEELLSMGGLSGNEDSPPIPVGRADFESSFNRIPGLAMTNFSEKTDDDDRLFLVKAAFDNLDALMIFLDSQGQQVKLEQDEDGTNILTVYLLLDTQDLDSDMLEAIPLIFNGYRFDFDIDFPQKCAVSFADVDGNALPSLPFGTTQIDSDSVEFSSSMSDLLTTGAAAAMVIRW